MEGGCGFGLPSGQEWMRSSARSGMGWSSRSTRLWRHTGGEEDNHYVSDSEHPSTFVWQAGLGWRWWRTFKKKGLGWRGARQMLVARQQNDKIFYIIIYIFSISHSAGRCNFHVIMFWNYHIHYERVSDFKHLTCLNATSIVHILSHNVRGNILMMKDWQLFANTCWIGQLGQSHSLVQLWFLFLYSFM